MRPNRPTAYRQTSPDQPQPQNDPTGQSPSPPWHVTRHIANANQRTLSISRGRTRNRRRPYSDRLRRDCLFTICSRCHTPNINPKPNPNAVNKTRVPSQRSAHTPTTPGTTISIETVIIRDAQE